MSENKITYYRFKQIVTHRYNKNLSADSVMEFKEAFVDFVCREDGCPTYLSSRTIMSIDYEPRGFQPMSFWEMIWMGWIVKPSFDKIEGLNWQKVLRQDVPEHVLNHYDFLHFQKLESRGKQFNFNTESWQKVEYPYINLDGFDDLSCDRLRFVRWLGVSLLLGAAIGGTYLVNWIFSA